MTERWVWFSETPVLLVFEDHRLDRFVAPLLSELRQERAPSPHFTITFATSRQLHRPPSSCLIHDGPLGAGLTTPGKIFARFAREWLVVDGLGSAEVDVETKSAFIRIAPDADALTASTIALFVIDVVLSSVNQHLLHGAALALPRRHGSIVLFAPSGAGKTTAALALAMAEFAILTDDALVLQRAQSFFAVWGLPRPMKVHWRTAQLLPPLQGILGPAWDHEGEQVLTREQYSKVGAVAVRANLPVTAIIILGERSNSAHESRPMSKADVALALAIDNIGLSRLGVLPRHVQKLEFVARMIASPGMQCARLHVGKPIETLGLEICRYCEASEDRLTGAA
jgi:hypothetical protein